MTVRQMLVEIPRRYPTIELILDGETEISSWRWFRIHFPNKWRLSCGYGAGHYADYRSQENVDHQSSTTVEVAIFSDKEEWYVVEGMDNITEYEEDDGTKTRTGVFGWVDWKRLCSIIDYVSAM